MKLLDYIRFKNTVKKRKLYWNILFTARENDRMTDTLVHRTFDRLNECDMFLLKHKKEFGYKPFEKIY